jgi:iron complex transport system ATP-binding protein
VLSEVRRLADRGAGIVLSTHDPDHAFAVAHRVALLHEGTIVTIGPPSDVLTAESLRQVYGIQVTIERLRNGQTICAPQYRV